MTLSRQFPGRAAGLLPYLEDPRVTDVLVNGTRSLFVERDGVLVPEATPFTDRAELADLIERLLVPLGKRIDAASPYADGRIGDAIRFHVILPPIAVEGPVVSFRKARGRDLAPLESFGPPELTGWLAAEVGRGSNVLLCGATGSGKTTLLTRLLAGVPPAERLVLVEESLEIRPDHPHVLHLEARPPSPDGTGEVTLRTLLRNALRMRPDRLVLGECRGAEAFDLIQAMNTGHRGSLSTLHANGALDGLRRLEGLVLLGAPGVPLGAVRSWIAGAVQVVAHLGREQGRRLIREVVMIQGLEGDVYRITPKYPCVNRSLPLF